jgi:hypothetical protein
MPRMAKGKMAEEKNAEYGKPSMAEKREKMPRMEKPSMAEG